MQPAVGWKRLLQEPKLDRKARRGAARPELKWGEKIRPMEMLMNLICPEAFKKEGSL